MYKNILLPIDTSAEAWKKTLPIAVDFAQRFGSTLRVMTVLPPLTSYVGSFFSKDHEKEAIKYTNDKLHQIVKEGVPEGIPVQHIVKVGTIYEEVITTAKQLQADLIIVSAHRPDFKDYLLGPNAGRVVRHSEISVFVVR